MQTCECVCTNNIIHLSQREQTVNNTIQMQISSKLEIILAV